METGGGCALTPPEGGPRTPPPQTGATRAPRRPDAATSASERADPSPRALGCDAAAAAVDSVDHRRTKGRCGRSDVLAGLRPTRKVVPAVAPFVVTVTTTLRPLAIRLAQTLIEK